KASYSPQPHPLNKSLETEYYKIGSISVIIRNTIIGCGEGSFSVQFKGCKFSEGVNGNGKRLCTGSPIDST
ncbi:hypothetical protein, partial [Halobacillus trueperi]|uniref:hypothetical protein n=1 Tax=Halobacillus trueperi TaxID=156205 RepID=UPI001C6E4958